MGTSTTTGGWDLAELWQRGRYRFTLNLIKNLPKHSRYMQARLNDDEVVEQEVREHGMPEYTTGMPLFKFDPTVEALAMVYDKLNEVIRTQYGAAGAKTPPKMIPFPRPTTAYDRVETKITDEQFLGMIGKLAPHEYDRVSKMINP